MTATDDRHDAAGARDRLVAAILAFLGHQDLLTRDDIRRALEREIDDAGPAAVLALKDRLQLEGGWTYYPPDPLARRIHHLLADRFLGPGSSVHDAHLLGDAGAGPVVLFANHLSYADANVVEVLLHREGIALSDRLTALAGPKVFTDRQRQFSSLCFGTIKVPQSAGVSSGEAVLGARDVARAAREAIDTAHARLRRGDVLLVFGEGTRSRSGRMQAMLAGVARYVDLPDTTVVPMGITGPELLFPVGEDAIRRATIALRVGAPIAASRLLAAAAGDRQLAMHAVGLAIADTLPASYRGPYADGGPSGVRDVLQTSRARS